MPAEREDEICREALELLSDLCSRGEVHNDNCLDFIYHFRDLARPRYTDSGKAVVLHLIRESRGKNASTCLPAYH
ncbi:hypothetical protein CRUP_018205 [Coryphaenoides rupestris]|nr:hypothetical protein CRUP_018205 [Coryphaenoides rupestris]